MSSIIYPKNCRSSIDTIVGKTGVSAETAYAMILMTALLMDLHPEDSDVVLMILQDCGVDADVD